MVPGDLKVLHFTSSDTRIAGRGYKKLYEALSMASKCVIIQRNIFLGWGLKATNQQTNIPLLHSSTVQTKIPVVLEIIFSLIYCMVTAIQADPEVAFRKLPSKEFFMFYFIAGKSD